ncbi:MAG TPA: alpha/beta hydrolase [Chloroflexota bacterium]|nr:alpha/beta hydrolase [Chloroflexota bacterium]
MAVESRTTHAAPGPAQPLIRYLLWATAAALGVTGAAAAVVSAVSGFLVYQYARARGQWGTDEPPAGMAEDVSFPAAPSDQGSVQLSGWFFSAAGVGGGGQAPAVVLCHGIGTGRRECLPIALRFAAAGYNVLCFDFRAHGRSDGQFSSVGLHETNDVIGGVQYLKQRPEVDPKRIGVVGFSMGAVATIQAAAQCADIAAVVADSAYASFLEAVRYSFRVVARLPHFPIASVAMHWAKWLVHVDPSALRPVDVIGRISPRPILVTHGTLDEIVPLNHAYTLFKAAEEPKELWIVPGARHVEARDLDPDDYFERIERFLGQALNPAGLVSQVPAAQAQASAVPTV